MLQWLKNTMSSLWGTPEKATAECKTLRQAQDDRGGKESEEATECKTSVDAKAMSDKAATMKTENTTDKKATTAEKTKQTK